MQRLLLGTCTKLLKDWLDKHPVLPVVKQACLQDIAAATQVRINILACLCSTSFYEIALPLSASYSHNHSTVSARQIYRMRTWMVRSMAPKETIVCVYTCNAPSQIGKHSFPWRPNEDHIWHLLENLCTGTRLLVQLEPYEGQSGQTCPQSIRPLVNQRAGGAA